MSKILTYSLLVFVMFTWGLNIVSIKYLVIYLPPIAMQGMRIFVAGLAALLVLYFLKDLRKLTRSEWQLAVWAALFGQLGHHTFLALGLAGTTATNGGLILGLIPLTTVIMTMVFLRERPTFLRFLGISLGFFGVSIVVLQNGEGLGAISRGDFFVFLSMVSQAFSFILIRKITATLSPRQLTAILLIIGSLMITSVSFLFEGNVADEIVRAPSSVWVVFFLSAILATGLGHIFYNLAIQQIGAGETAIFNNLVPFFTLVGAFLFLGETIHFTQVIGFIFIVIGVFFGTGYLEMRVNHRMKYKKTG